MLRLGLAGVLRFAWRFGNQLPALRRRACASWQQVAARFVHLCFIALMFALCRSPVGSCRRPRDSRLPFFGPVLLSLTSLRITNEHRSELLLRLLHKAWDTRSYRSSHVATHGASLAPPLHVSDDDSACARCCRCDNCAGTRCASTE
jgi:cytochrome b561